jgi:hypothetical protein
MNAAKNTFTGFDDLGNDFNDISNTTGKPDTVEEASMGARHTRKTAAQEVKLFREKCKKCGGSGKYFHPSTHGNQCFECGGVGYKEFKTSAEQRAKARGKAAERKFAKADEELRQRQIAFDQFEAENPEIAAWWRENTWEFSQSLRAACFRYGKLTEGQHAAALRTIEKGKQRQAERAQAVADAPVLETESIERAIRTAKANGLGKPKVRLAGKDEFTIVVYEAVAHSVNAGSLYVKSTDGEYMGKITNGKFLHGRDCTPEQRASIIEMFKDSLASAVAYGNLTGTCSCCGRELSNEESVRLGIGPICRSKFFG